MVNVEKLLEKLDGFVYEEEGDIRLCRHALVLWNEDVLKEVATIPQLMGKINNLLPIGCYDEIYARLDNTIFEPNLAKVKENLEKLGLIGYINENVGYKIGGSSYIMKENFLYVENMQPIPNLNIEWVAERLYNDILKASKEWNND